jgi:hypothetical protein
VYSNFIVVGTQRTGSSALAEQIGAHRHVACGWEWTEALPRDKKIRAMELGLAGNFSLLAEHHQQHMADELTSDSRWLGFRRLFGASDKWIVHPSFSLKLWQDRFVEHLRWIRAHPDIHIIHMQRNNHVAWIRSKFLARATGVYVGGKYPDSARVRIPVGAAIARIRAKVWLDEQLMRLKNSNPYLQIRYEDFLCQADRETARVLAFLECEPELYEPVETTIRPQSTGKDRDHIENYDELIESLDKLGLTYSG